MAPGENILWVDADRAASHIFASLIRQIRSSARVVWVPDAAELATQFARTDWSALILDPGTANWLPPVRMAQALRERCPDAQLVVWSKTLDPQTAAALARHRAVMVPDKTFETLVALPGWLGYEPAPPERAENPPPVRPSSGTAAEERRASSGRSRRRRRGLEPEPIPGLELDSDATLGPEDLASPLRPTRRPRTWIADTRADEPVPAITPGKPAERRDAELEDGPPTQPPQSDTVPPPVHAPPAELVHDLKEPLRTIELLLQRCEKRHREILPQEAKTLIQSARRSAQQLSEQIEESMTQLPRPPPVADADRVLAEGLIHLEALRGETGARITHDPLPRLAVTASGLRRVFENLLANAMRYRGAQAPEIHVSAQLLDDEAILSVADNGRGIPDALHDQLFDAGVKGPDGGAGIGLSSVRRIVEQWGGEIWFDTVVGEGSTFFVSAPLTPTGAERRPQEQKI